MTIPLEIMLRGNDRVYTETILQPGDPASWTERDVASLLKSILVTIDRVQNPGKEEAPDVALRGLSWIVHPIGGDVVIALEIHTASAVAGPLTMPPGKLEALIVKAVKTGTPGTVVH
jgi:hypothetical protein